MAVNVRGRQYRVLALFNLFAKSGATTTTAGSLTAGGQKSPVVCRPATRHPAGSHSARGTFTDSGR